MVREGKGRRKGRDRYAEVGVVRVHSGGKRRKKEQRRGRRGDENPHR
jgi:hypothetical protein